MENKGQIAAVLIVGVFAISFAFLWMSTNSQLIQARAEVPSFISKTQDGGYTMTYAANNCVTVLTLQQGAGRIWYQTGSGELGCSTPSSSYQSLIDQAIAEHKATCLAFSPNYNGTMTFSYSTEPLCGDPWHSMVVVPNE